MTNRQLLDDAKAAAFDVHVYEGEYAHHITEYTFDENGLAKFAELILASKPQATPSQSDERAELALFKEWFQSAQGIEYQGIYTFTHDAWMARAQLSKPQPTSQDVGDELIKAMREGYKIQYYPPLEYLTDEANSEQAWVVERMQAPFCGNDGIRIWSASSPIAAVNKARQAIKDKL